MMNKTNCTVKNPFSLNTSQLIYMSSYHIASSQSQLFVKLWTPDNVIIILTILRLLLQINIFDFIL